MAPNGYHALIRSRVEQSIAVKRALLEEAGLSTIERFAATLVEAYRTQKKVLLFGNGGSAADAQHIAAELVGRFANANRRGLPAIALTVNSSVTTALANDIGYDLVFARQVEALGQEGDVAIGLSTSGNSANVVQGIKVARARGLHTLALTGDSGGRLKQAVDCCLCVPSHETPRIQESHILLGHIICELVELELFGVRR